MLPLGSLEGLALRMKGWLRVHLEDPYAAQIIDEKVEGEKAVTSLGAVILFSPACLHLQGLQGARELQVVAARHSKATPVVMLPCSYALSSAHRTLDCRTRMQNTYESSETSKNSASSLSGSGCHLSTFGRSKSCRLPHC